MDKVKLPREDKKRRNILDAARSLMLRNGLRGTTMEAIAHEAGVAKPTLYAKFSDKDAVFFAVIEDIVQSVCGAFEIAIEGDAEVTKRVGEALSEKFCAFARILDGSPHADDFFEGHKRIASQFEAFDAQIERDITATLQDAGVKDAAGLTRTITASAYGIGRSLRDENEIRENIMLMSERMIRPALT